MDNEVKEKVTYLESKGFKYQPNREVWISKAGEISCEFVEDHTLEELKRKLPRVERASEYRKIPFKLYNS